MQKKDREEAAAIRISCNPWGVVCEGKAGSQDAPQVSDMEDEARVFVPEERIQGQGQEGKGNRSTWGHTAFEVPVKQQVPKMVLMQERNTDADVESELVDAVGEGEGRMN